MKKKSTFEREMENSEFKEAFEKEKSIDEKVIGLTLEEARKLWDDIRVVRIDGRSTVCIRNYVVMRMNVEVMNDKIVKFINFG